MTIPEISPLFLVSMCGLSTVCVGLFAVIAVLSVRFFAGDLWDTVTGVFEQGDNSRPATAQAQSRISQRADLRAKAQSLNFDPTGGGAELSAQNTSSDQFGENTLLRPDRRPRFNEKKRDWNLAPPERMSDDPRNLKAPPPPDFSAGSEYLPNERSNIGGRVGRHNTGRGQTGQRMDSSRFSSGSSSLRSDRNARRDDEFFGGQADFDGDGDVDI